MPVADLADDHETSFGPHSSAGESAPRVRPKRLRGLKIDPVLERVGQTLGAIIFEGDVP